MPKGRGILSHCRGDAGQGGILFPKRIPPLEPPEKGEGRTPRPPTLPDWSSKSCTRYATADNRREASRIAMLNAALPRAGIPIPEAKGLFKPETANLTPFFWTATPPVFFLGKENGGVWCCRPQAAFSSAPVWNYHRSSSSNFIIASSCSRICAFIGPSSRWS